MNRRHLFQLITLLMLGLSVLLLGACTGTQAGEPSANELPTPTVTMTPDPDEAVSSDDPAPQEEPTPVSGEVRIEQAVITAVEIRMMESWPLQASVYVEGELGDGCTELGPIETTREGNTFTVSIKTVRPEDAVCTMILRTFSENIALDIHGLEAGTYVVDVNGVQETFTLEQDNVMTPEGEDGDDAANSDVDLSAEDQAELIRLTLEKALLDQEIPDYQLLTEQENIILSTENIDSSLVPELEGVNLTLLSPDEIQERANEQGDFLFLRFDEISAQSDGKVTVSLSNAWAVAEDSEKGYLSGGGFTMEYTREDSEWSGEVTTMWIS